VVRALRAIEEVCIGAIRSLGREVIAEPLEARDEALPRDVVPDE
jgi:hypothetical protein